MQANENIRRLRNEKGHKQQYMAAELKISQPAYSKIECRKTKVSAKTGTRIAKILQVPVSKIYNPVDNPENKPAIDAKVIELYEKLIEADEKVIALQEILLKEGKKKE